MASDRSRNWVFTLNNYTAVEDEALRVWMANETNLVRGGFGREVGESGTPHLQGWISMKNAIRMSTCKRINGRAHWEIMGGTVADSIRYCSKEGNYFSYGGEPTPGKRTDILTMTQMVASGASDREVFVEFGDRAMRVGNQLQRVRAAFREELRNWEMDVRIFWGPPGTGKTRAAWDEFGIENVYAKMPGKWWDGYQGQRCVLIDDFDPDDRYGLTFDFYLKLLDRYPMRIEWKGGSGQFYSRVIVITSNYDPNEWFNDKPNRSAFFRRITETRFFGHRDTDTEVQQGNTGTSGATLLASGTVEQEDEPTWAGI